MGRQYKAPPQNMGVAAKILVQNFRQFAFVHNRCKHKTAHHYRNEARGHTTLFPRT
jgi:hypothetical protein